MKPGGNNFAFIDSQNLNLNIRRLGWALDFYRFHIYLREHYGISKAFLFIGYIEGNKKLYEFLENCGYKIIFKPVSFDLNGKPKGNVDTDIVLHTMIQFNNFNQAVIVSGDGDFYNLIQYLKGKDKLKRLLAPTPQSCSVSLKKIAFPHLDFVSNLRNKLEYKKSP